jgi:hypothetical protein
MWQHGNPLRNNQYLLKSIAVYKLSLKIIHLYRMTGPWSKTFKAHIGGWKILQAVSQSITDISRILTWWMWLQSHRSWQDGLHLFWDFSCTGPQSKLAVVFFLNFTQYTSWSDILKREICCLQRTNSPIMYSHPP